MYGQDTAGHHEIQNDRTGLEELYLHFSKGDPLAELRRMLERHLDASEEELTVLLLQLFAGVDKVTPDEFCIRGNINIAYNDPPSMKITLLKALPKRFPRLYDRPRTINPEDKIEIDRFVRRRYGFDDHREPDNDLRDDHISGKALKGAPPVIIADANEDDRDSPDAPKEILQGDLRTLRARSVVQIRGDCQIRDHYRYDPGEKLHFARLMTNRFDAVFVDGDKETRESRELDRIAGLQARGKGPEEVVFEQQGLDRFLGAVSAIDAPAAVKDSGVNDDAFMEGYILFARERCHPRMPGALLEAIKARFRGILEEKKGVLSKRHMGSVIRFSEALARARLDDEVRPGDVELAFRLLEHWKTALQAALDKEPGYGPDEHEIAITKAQEPRFGLNDVVLAPELRERLEMALAQARHAKKIFDDWGMGEVVKYGKGLVLLLYGLPGTGKTMAAEAVASELGKKLLVVNHAGIASCWYGQSERNIYKAFQEAKKEGAVLVFDEADSILGARLNARHSTDMAVNREVNTMLREIEQFEGVVILTTNRHTVLDEALDRRINLKLEMPMPGPAQRAEIWRRHFSSRTPLADDVNFEALGKEFEMAGGNIKNAVMNAVRLAAFRELDRIDMAVLREVAEQESVGIRSCQFSQEAADQKLKEAAAKVRNRKDTEGYS